MMRHVSWPATTVDYRTSSFVQSSPEGRIVAGHVWQGLVASINLDVVNTPRGEGLCICVKVILQAHKTCTSLGANVGIGSKAQPAIVDVLAKGRHTGREAMWIRHLPTLFISIPHRPAIIDADLGVASLFPSIDGEKVSHLLDELLADASSRSTAVCAACVALPRHPTHWRCACQAVVQSIVKLQKTEKKRKHASSAGHGCTGVRIRGLQN
mmetsp:Transcript_52134/g.93461  ORF Transcript_52134/g.93461 Transcript_52134/m.93461 type:complete len:211 (+) Transcript_52134:872-1504(+)